MASYSILLGLFFVNIESLCVCVCVLSIFNCSLVFLCVLLSQCILSVESGIFICGQVCYLKLNYYEHEHSGTWVRISTQSILRSKIDRLDGCVHLYPYPIMPICIIEWCLYQFTFDPSVSKCSCSMPLLYWFFLGIFANLIQ